MSTKKKILIIIISCILIFGIKTTVKANNTGHSSKKIINPLYEELKININDDSKNKTRNILKNSGLVEDEESYTEDKNKFASDLRDNAINRNNKFMIYFRIETEEQIGEEQINEYATEAFNNATSEELAENSSGGDYLKWSWYEFKYSADWKSYLIDEKYTNYIIFKFNLIYFTTFAQEEELDADIQAYVNELDSNLSDYEKITTVYHYITTNVKYDDENDDSYLLKYSAYAAFENKTSVCQGYANLLYKMLKEAGVQNVRIIASDTHAWNIVKFEDIYYCVDSTWDADLKQNGFEYRFFLKGLNTFNGLRDHTMMDEFLQSRFTSNYPISTEDYVFSNNGQNENGGNGTNNGNETGNNENQTGNNGTQTENNDSQNGTNANNTNTENSTNTNQTINTDTNIKPNTTTANNNVQSTIKNPNKITGFKLKTNYTNKVKLKWDKQSQITTYKIELYNKKTRKYECKKTLNSDATSATIKGLIDGTTYKFRIRAIKTVNGKNYYGEYTYLKITTKPNKVKISKIKSTAKKEMNIYWKKISNSTGYELQYSLKNNFKGKKSVKIKSKKTLNKTIKNLKSNKKYYIRIRAYKLVDGKKIYGDFSKVKNIKIK